MDKNVIRDSSKTLVQIVETKLGNIFTSSSRLYFAYIVCANIIDTLGTQCFKFTPDTFYQIGVESKGKFKVKLKDGVEVDVIPELSEWRNFLSERQVQEWFDFRWIEKVKSAKTEYINKITEGIPLKSSDNQAMNVLTKIEKTFEQGTLDKSQVIIEMYAAPLMYGQPNGDSIVEEKSRKINFDELKDELMDMEGDLDE